ncbi:MAG: hypothetical protein PUP90_16675 [Nostoc sp. S4]|nr:hypothetical protein [Nostoc sp. S4]
MNNFAKALVLALIFAAPVAISVPAVQAETVRHPQVKTTKVHHKHYKHRKHHLVKKVHK